MPFNLSINLNLRLYFAFDLLRNSIHQMKFALFLFLVIVFFSCKNTQEKSGASLPTFTSDMDSILSGILPDSLPGGAYLVMKNEEIVYSNGFGIADVETEEKITPNTVFNLGSLGKTFVAFGILKLQEDGLLSIEDSIHKYFPDFKDPKIAQEVKIKHLLSHTSGLIDNRYFWEDSVYYLSAKDSANFAPLKTCDSIHFKPGEKYEYSNPAFNGLALIIEQITKNRWQDYIIDNIFKPSNMPTSKVTDGPHPAALVAHGYDLVNGKYIEYDYNEFMTFAAAGNGGIWSSVVELANYERAITSAAFLKKETIELSRTIFVPENWKDSIAPNIGFSWFMKTPSWLFKENPPTDYSVFGHTGSQGGFQTFYFIIPEHNIFFTGIVNNYLSTKEYVAIIEKHIETMIKHNWLD